MQKVIVSIDGHCNIPNEIYEKFGIFSIPFEVVLDGKIYEDTQNCIRMEDVVEAWERRGVFPQTAAISLGRYMDFFTSKTSEGYQIIHINLGSGGSACFNNCRLAINSLNLEKSVFQFDSQNISFGLLILAIHAVELVGKYNDIPTVLSKLLEYRELLKSSYYISRLDFLSHGGRLINIQETPSKDSYYEIIIQDNKTRFKAQFEDDLRQALAKIIKNKFNNLAYNKKYVFVDTSMFSSKDILQIKELLQRYNFENIFVTNATCSCAGHWGPKALGIYFEVEH